MEIHFSKVLRSLFSWLYFCERLQRLQLRCTSFSQKKKYSRSIDISLDCHLWERTNATAIRAKNVNFWRPPLLHPCSERKKKGEEAFPSYVLDFVRSEENSILFLTRKVTHAICAAVGPTKGSNKLDANPKSRAEGSLSQEPNCALAFACLNVVANIQTNYTEKERGWAR